MSKFLSMILPYSPETIGLKLDEQGWINVNELQCKAPADGNAVGPDMLREIVKINDKQRFAFNENGIRRYGQMFFSIDRLDGQC